MKKAFVEVLAMNKRIIIYIRVSTHIQVKGTSLTTQEELCRATIKTKLGDIDPSSIQVISDLGSGATMNRSGMKQIEDLIEKGDISHIVFFSIDRVSRNQLDFLTFLQKITGLGIHWISVRDQLDSDHPMGTSIASQVATFSQFELEIVRERLLSGRKKVQEQGKFPGGVVPYGYKADKKSPSGLIVVETEASKIRSIFYYRKRLKYGYLKIAKSLNSRDFVKRDGKPWTAKAVERILKNEPFYQGKVALHKDQLMSLHESIL